MVVGISPFWEGVTDLGDESQSGDCPFLRNGVQTVCLR
jgi:hypothetical protein